MQKKIIPFLLLPFFFIQCSDDSSETTPNLVDTTAVMQHPAKTGVHDAFTSAYFGDAGRWMTTNLVAKAYDSKVTTATLPSVANGASSLTNPQWCYPSAANPTTTTEYMANKNLGLLYNWAAVTATTQNNNESNEEMAHAMRQGICPDGWHVPSHKEWAELEAEFTTHKSKYSTISVDGSPGNNGLAMRDTAANGMSKTVSEGGFAALLAGNASGGTNSNFANVGYFWTSSSNSIGASWYRAVYSTNPDVAATSRSRDKMFAVRCKRDNNTFAN